MDALLLSYTIDYKVLNSKFRDNDKDYSAMGYRNLINKIIKQIANS
jgi:hypothetical protein